MYAGNTAFDAVNAQAALGQLDLLPLQVAHLRGPQTVAIGDKDHGCIAMPVATMLASAVHQPLDLTLGEIASLDCQVYDAWGAFLGCRFHAGKPCLRVSYCIGYIHLLHSQVERRLCFMVGGETRHQHQPSTMHLRFLGMHPPDSAGRD